mmetsp:Transcript_70013/g.210329  ORF Transcript_70013/g.210329 Transcript_70013/m.210329 type:complete len:274 (-) Transcript_70013:108-929(-)
MLVIFGAPIRGPISRKEWSARWESTSGWASSVAMYSPSASSRLCANLASCGSSHPGGGSSGSDPSDVSCECISCECISRNSEYRLSSMYRAPLHATWTGYAHGPVASSRTAVEPRPTSSPWTPTSPAGEKEPTATLPPNCPLVAGERPTGLEVAGGSCGLGRGLVPGSALLGGERVCSCSRASRDASSCSVISAVAASARCRSASASRSAASRRATSARASPISAIAAASTSAALRSACSTLRASTSFVASTSIAACASVTTFPDGDGSCSAG